MGKVLQMLAGGFASLGTPILRRNYAGFSSTPFTDDRRRLQKDWENVRRDLSKEIEKAKKELWRRNTQPLMFSLNKSAYT